LFALDPKKYQPSSATALIHDGGVVRACVCGVLPKVVIQKFISLTL